jgi:hypothetical protein
VLIDRQTAVLKLNCQVGNLRWEATTPANNETLVCVHVCVCACVFMFVLVRACVSGHISTSSHLRTYLLVVVCFYMCIATFMCTVSV